MPKVSVIIPVYNVEKYLRGCLDSVVNQTLKDIEIICVDDGSTDGSFAILEEYASKDSRIKVLKQQNAGAGVARNAGLAIAKGEYLLFLDSDDIYTQDIALESYNYAKEKDADIVFWNYAKLNTKTNEISHIRSSYSLQVGINYSKTNEAFSFHNTSPNPWTKLFKKSFIDKNNLTFQNLSSCNDIAFVWKSMVLADSIYYLDKELITYRTQCDNTISANRYKKANNIIEAAKEIENILKNIGNKKILDKFYICIISSFIYEYLQFPKNVSSKIYIDNILTFLPFKYKKGFKKCLKKKRYNSEYFHKKSNLVKKIFSINNSKDNKYTEIYLLGIKMKLKKNKLKNIVLVTGGAGFIGSHTVDKLIEQGRNVIVVDRNKKGFRNPKAKYYYMDINSKNLERVFKNNDIKQIIHLAAQTSVSYSNKYPEDDAQNNIIASIKLIELAKKYNIEKFVVASTAAVYANPKYLPVDETHPLDSISPYGISKRTMEDYLKISGINYVICRFSNVYGPRQNSEGEAGVVAIFVDKMIQNQEVQIHGDGTQTRDFIYVKDVADALVKINDSNIGNEIFNISTNTQKNINELFETLKNVTNYNKEPCHTNSRVGDIKDSVLDNSKLCENFKYNKSSFEDGLLKTVNYLRGNKND